MTPMQHSLLVTLSGPLAAAVAVAELAYKEGLAARPRPDDLQAYINSLMFEPVYQHYM